MKEHDIILEKAIHLFADHGYEKTSMKDIADAAKIATVDIYRYFDSKRKILEEIYLKYEEVVIEKRLTADEYMPILQNGSPQDIIGIFNYPLPEPIPLNFDVIRIVWQRKGTDKQAKEIYVKYTYEEGLSYVHEVLNKGVEMGRLEMDAKSIECLSNFLYAIREHSAGSAVLMPDQAKWRAVETDMMNTISEMIIVKEDMCIEPEQDRVIDSMYQLIEYDSIAIGKYHYYISELKRQGYDSIASSFDEILQNLLDELDVIYSWVYQECGSMDKTAICQSIIEIEKQKRWELKRQHLNNDPEVLQMYAEIAALSAQHERLCKLILDKL